MGGPVPTGCALGVALLAVGVRLAAVLAGGGLGGLMGYDDGVYYAGADAMLAVPAAAEPAGSIRPPPPAAGRAGARCLLHSEDLVRRPCRRRRGVAARGRRLAAGAARRSRRCALRRCPVGALPGVGAAQMTHMV